MLFHTGDGSKLHLGVHAATASARPELLDAWETAEALPRLKATLESPAQLEPHLQRELWNTP